jgi:hypothetical protein
MDRGIDRQFSPVTRNYWLYLKNTFTDLALPHFTEKPFFGHLDPNLLLFRRQKVRDLSKMSHGEAT